ncbi:MAG TPA: DUF2264 domain-containing protein [Bryobacteraceae bacterium]|jgi:hypothetical protein|nr:DUF2264 domain-containing protein [Bryobacteraceae bacterium]
MTNRRAFFQSVAGLGMAAAVPQPPPETDRQYWVRTLTRLAGPMLRNLGAGTLKRNMPVECLTGNPADRRKYTHLEAIGRLLAGIAPWLEAPLEPGVERDLQQQHAALAREAIRSATDQSSADFLNFHDGAQPLVDSGFLAQAVLRAPNELWKKLDPKVQRNLAAALLSSRVITPGFNNWLLFAATVEAALATMGERWDGMRIDYAVRQHQQWYLGDGVYGDGPHFHWDYYNAFVIHPMLVDVLRNMGAHSRNWESLLPDTMARAKRYAAIQERLISPEGTFPAVGRSITYRCGAFQVLAQMALLGELPAPLTGARVRSALTAVIHRSLEAPGTFDQDGWLTVGFCGHQPHLGESYISTGSLYLTAAVLLPLGLRADHAFWTAPAEDWTARRLWRGEDGVADHAI